MPAAARYLFAITCLTIVALLASVLIVNTSRDRAARHLADARQAAQREKDAANAERAAVFLFVQPSGEAKRAITIDRRLSDTAIRAQLRNALAPIFRPPPATAGPTRLGRFSMEIPTSDEPLASVVDAGGRAVAINLTSKLRREWCEVIANDPDGPKMVVRLEGSQDPPSWSSDSPTGLLEAQCTEMSKLIRDFR